MRFSTSDPPEFKSKHWDFSGASINPYRCFYYLSLLERFVETTHDMPESVLKLYLVRAEYRYYRWISSNSYRNSTPPLGELIQYVGLVLEDWFYFSLQRCRILLADAYATAYSVWARHRTAYVAWSASAIWFISISHIIARHCCPTERNCKYNILWSLIARTELYNSMNIENQLHSHYWGNGKK